MVMGAAQVLQIVLVEPITYLRLPSRNASLASEGNYSGAEETLDQLRGVILIKKRSSSSSSSQAPAAGSITRLNLTFRGLTVWIDWQAKFPENRQREIYSRSIELEDYNNISQIPFSFPLPKDLPPTVTADFGCITYALIAKLYGSSSSSSSSSQEDVTAEVPIKIIHDTTTGDNVVEQSHRTVQGDWKDLLHYKLCVVDKVPIGEQIRISISFQPLRQVSLHSIQLSLEEKTMTDNLQNTVSRQWQLWKVQSPSGSVLMPWKLNNSCLPPPELLFAAQLGSTEAQTNQSSPKEKHQMPDSEEGGGVTKEAAVEMLTSRHGPWTLAWDAQIPSCRNTAINLSVRDEKSAITIEHRLVLSLIVNEEGSDRGCYSTVEIFKPITILSSYLADTNASPPCYCCAQDLDHPWEVEYKWRKLAAEAAVVPSTIKAPPETETNVLPGWLDRILKKRQARTAEASSSSTLLGKGKELSHNDVSKLWLSLSSNIGKADRESTATDAQQYFNAP